MPGPVPKRSDERLGNPTKARDVDPIDKAPGAETVTVPDPEEDWHWIARDWYLALAESGQSRYFEPSDWLAAKYVAEMMSTTLFSEKVNAQLVATVMSGMDNLLTTEGARRRLRLELQRPAEQRQESAPDNVTRMEKYRQMYA